VTSFAAIYPGQGAQLVGMGRDVAAAHPVAAQTFAQADEILGFGLSTLCFEGPAERLDATDIQQPAIFTTSVALYRAAVACGRVPADAFVAMGGLSLGEYPALHLADAGSFADARPANFNCPGQIVISGDLAACEAAAAAAGAFSLKAVPLKVAGAFHSEHMRPAAEGLRSVLAATEFRPPRVRVISNVNAQYHAAPDAMREALYQQVVSPVRWQACVERLLADGCGAFWELGPNRHLTGMMKKISRATPTTNLSTAADLAAGQ